MSQRCLVVSYPHTARPQRDTERGMQGCLRLCIEGKGDMDSRCVVVLSLEARFISTCDEKAYVTEVLSVLSEVHGAERLLGLPVHKSRGRPLGYRRRLPHQ